MQLICPKCGRPVEENAVICRGCDFILDTGFLGDGILDEEQSLRPGAGGVDPGAFNLADAVILGNIDDDSQSFETSDSGFHMQAHLQARLYVSGRSQALMSPDAVPALAQTTGGDGLRLTPFEKHVLAFIDGKRPVEVIRRAAGLDEAEVKTALATLADKGVVKVVGRALADFDPGTETAPRRAPPRHRMRGSVVGAVALVGDEADKAIEEAFRTQVALSPITGAMLAKGAALDGGDVFGEARPARKSSRETGPQNQNLSDLPSDIDQFVGLKGTDEIEKKKLLGNVAEASSSTLRPSAQKAAVNRAPSAKVAVRNHDDSQEGIDASAEASAVERSIVDKSDGFDDFGQPSDVSTAVVAQQISDSSSPGASPERPRSGVFADISQSDVPVDLNSVQQLADSRVVQRPKLTGVGPRPAVSPHMASSNSGAVGRAEDSLDDSSAPSLSSDSPSVEIERQAASGEVWDERKDAPRPPPSAGVKKTSTTSLSQLLSDNEEEATANIPPERAQMMIAAGQKRRAAQDEDSSFEEPTAAGQPPPPMALPRVGPKPAMVARVPPAKAAPPAIAKAAPVAEATSARPSLQSRQRGKGSAMVSMPDGQNLDAAMDESSGLHEVQAKQGAVHDIFDENSDGFQAPTGPELSRGPAPRMTSASSSEGSSGSMPRSLVQSIEVKSVHESGDETAPPSQEPAPSSEAMSSEPAPSEPAPSEPASSEPPTGSREAEDDSDSSIEMVDSGLVIRPAAKANPLARARVPQSNPRRIMASSEGSASDPRQKPAAAPPPAPAPAPPAPAAKPAASVKPPTQQAASPAAGRVPIAKKDDPNATFAQSLEESLSVEPPEESSEATVNIDRDEQQRRGLDGARGALIVGGKAGGVAAIPSGFSQVVAQEQLPRAKVTDENRRKARKLFEEAVKEAEAGKLGAARMNAKLASIYDPENAVYREQLEAWERPATMPKPPAPQTAQQQQQMSSRPSDESQAEIKALYDEAQRYEDNGDVDEALDILEQGVARYPSAAAFYNRIGVILALRKRDYEGAVQAIQRAIDIDPDNLHYKSNLGKIVAKMRGRGADA